MARNSFGAVIHSELMAHDGKVMVCLEKFGCDGGVGNPCAVMSGYFSLNVKRGVVVFRRVLRRKLRATTAYTL